MGLPAYSDRSPGAIAARTTVAAVIGGTASALGGGKFANGAFTAAFQHLLNAEARSSFLKKDSLTSTKRIAFYQAGDKNLQAQAEYYAGEKNAHPVSGESGIQRYYDANPRVVHDEIMLFMHSGEGAAMTFNSPMGGIPVSSDSPLWKTLSNHLFDNGTITFASTCGLGGCGNGQQYVTDIASKIPGYTVRAPQGNFVQFTNQGLQTTLDFEGKKPVDWEWFTKKY